jgi:ketosteroid isomerase-like protein
MNHDSDDPRGRSDDVTHEAAPASPGEHLRIVQLLYAAFGRRDIAGMLALLDPEVEWGEPANPFNPAGGTRRGHDGFLEWLRTGNEAEEVLELVPQRFLTDADAVAVVGFTRCRVRATGRTYATDFVHLAVLRGGRVIRFQEFFDTWAAAEAFRPA